MNTIYIRKGLVVLFVLLPLVFWGQQKTINVLDFGAKADGKTLNTTAIQAGIDSLARLGGGKLIIPEGRFLSGSIVLKSGVEIHLQKNAFLLGSTDPSQYKSLKRWKALILAEEQTNICISGKGTIDGQGRRLALNIDSLYYFGKLDPQHYNLRRKRPNEDMRPQIINFGSCKNLKITGITIKNSSSWVQTYDKCRNLTVDSVRVISDAYWNNDGIDISDCKNVRVTNCFVNSADDGICLKSSDKDDWNDSIYIANCTVRSSANAIKFGTASTGGFKNVTIENIKVYDTFRSAIALEAVDGGLLENIVVNNITATNTGNGIFIRLGHRNKDERYSILRNVSIKNVKIEISFDRPDKNYDLRGPDLPFFHNPFPCSITGIEGHPVENVSLENIEISYPGRGNDGLAILPIYRLKDVPEQEAEYPEFSMFGELPAWAFYVRHVNGLSIKNVTVKAEAPDYRPAFVFDNVDGLRMDKIQIIEDDTKPQIILREVTDKTINFYQNLIKTVQ
ncbi:MAG TPA: glycoside hydrolase family 28 protein [Prolixibacteraceae bacterium]|nr:glycoside hydrolase family 28 protein [Prolixibacteraceae bacterium]